MHFNNPEIIKTETDVILGSAKVSGENENYIGLMERCRYLLEYHIHQDILALVDGEISHQRALMLTANKIYLVLDMYEQIPPKDEEHLAEIITQSKNYEMWASDIKRRFFETHSGKVEINTKIPAVVEGGLSQDDIKGILNETNLDKILEVLAMYMDIGYPSNN
jgi:hypothetical protein